MILLPDIQRVINNQQLLLERDFGIPREKEIALNKKFAVIISGIRRCGKSTLARQVIQDKQPVYFLNFEDINLTGFEKSDFIKLEKAFKETLGANGVYFFDEIQNVQGWESYIRQLVDEENEVIITGSNASMLSKELGTKLTGRQLTKELFPFSYNEFLTLKQKADSSNTFQEYLEKGGFPEFLKTNDREIIRNLFQDIIYRDVFQRNDIRNEVGIKTLLQFLLSNIGKPTSYNKLKSLINAGAGNTISQYIYFFEQAYLLFAINRFDYSIKKQLVSPKKIYCIDNAIIAENAFSFSENKGRMLENTVFIELKRRGKEIYYHQGKYECDFVIKEKNKITEVFQVCWELNDDNRIREIEGLIETQETYNLNNGYILTFDQEDVINISDRQINILPVRQWLLKIHN